jgi:tetratricopeptide (TPR) repeat protein
VTPPFSYSTERGVYINSIINRIERERYSFLLGFIGLFCIITVRNIFESAFEGTQTFGFSPITENSFFMVFSHFPLFYISLLIWFCLFLVLITKEKPNVIIKPLLIGMSVIIITPFIDIVVSRGSGYKLTYLKGVEEFTQIYKFFDFTRDLLQASWGQRIEVIAVLIGATIYVFVKTKSVLKILITPIISYLIIFIHGTLPNTIAQIPSYLGYTQLHYRTIITAGILGIDSQNYSIVFICSIVVTGWLVLRKYDRAFAHDILRFKRSLLVILSMLLGIIYAIFLIRPYFPLIFASSVHYLIFLTALFAVHLVRMTSLWRKSSFHFALLTISSLLTSLAIGFTYFFIILSYFVFLNYIEPALSTRISKHYSWKYLTAGISSIFAFIAGFSIIFQQATFSCIIPYDHTRVQAYGYRIAGWNHFINGDYSEAIACYGITYSLGTDSEINKRLGQSYLQTGSRNEGISMLQAVQPLDYETILSLGQAYIQTGKPDDALRLYRNAVSEHIEPVEFLTLLAQAAARRGSKAEMDSLLLTGNKHGMSRSRFHQITGDYHLQSRDYDQAITAYERALYYNSRSTLAYAGKGMAYYGKGDLSKAEQAFLKAQSFDPKNDVLYNNLGAIYIIKKEYKKAEYHFNKSLKINPLQAEAYYNLGLIAQALGRNNEAITMYSEALRINPGFLQARIALERMQGDD